MVATKDHSYVFNFPVSFYNYTRRLYWVLLLHLHYAYVIGITSCWHMYVMLAYVRHIGMTSCWHILSHLGVGASSSSCLPRLTQLVRITWYSHHSAWLDPGGPDYIPVWMAK